MKLIKTIPYTFGLYNYEVGRDQAFYIKHPIKGYCLFSFTIEEEVPSEDISICILRGTGELSYHVLGKEIPEKLFVQNYEDLLDIAKNWSRNYCGAY